jgi:hypothetical protein
MTSGAIDVAAKAGFHLRMRKDLVFAIALAAISLILALAGVFLEWSPVLIGILIAVMVAADGYFVWGFIAQNKKPPASQDREGAVIPGRETRKSGSPT